MSESTPTHVGFVAQKDSAQLLPIYQCPLCWTLTLSPERHEATHPDGGEHA